MLPLLFAARAAAEPAFTDQGFVLVGPESGSFAGGISAPTVDVDEATGLYSLYFESQQATAAEGCSGSWLIGRATSTDGRSWTLDEVPILEPDASDPGSNTWCSVSQPAVVYDGTTWHLFYSGATADSGLNLATGIGYATSSDGVGFTRVADPLIPFTGAAIGLSSATLVGGEIWLYYTLSPDIHLARVSADGLGSVSDVGLVMDDDAQTWSSTWLLGASALCVDGESPSWEMFVGGDAIGLRSLAHASSVDGATWSFDADAPLDGGDLAYADLKHWDALGFNGSGDFLLWYSTDDSDGRKAVGLAVTTESWSLPQPRACDSLLPDEGDTGDTGADTGTETGDTGTETGDTGDDGGGGHCGCDGWGWHLVGPGLSGLVFVGGRRRRA